jgi:DNA-binding MarR family transcriptional regulator
MPAIKRPTSRPTRAATPRPPPVGAQPSAVRTWLAVVRTYLLCDEVMALRLAPLGVRIAEHEVLANVASEPGLSQQELAARCFTAKSHVSALVVSLEQRGWLQREVDSADARVRRLRLTRSGEAIARKTLAVQAEVVQAMAAQVSDAELLGIEAAMQRVGQALEALRAR